MRREKRDEERKRWGERKETRKERWGERTYAIVMSYTDLDLVKVEVRRNFRQNVTG